jgi:hypothetical protein
MTTTTTRPLVRRRVLRLECGGQNAPRGFAGAGRPSTPRLVSETRQVLKPDSRYLMPCVGLDPAAADQGGRGGQRQHGMYLRGGEHLAGQRPIAGQQFSRTPVMIRASSHRELSRGLGGSMTGKRGIGFRENQDTRPHGDRTAVVLHNEEHGNARGPVQRAANREIPGQSSPVCLVGGPAMRTGTSEPRDRAS